MRKPENTFIAAVHKQLPADTPYREKMNNPYRGGTPDVWYSGEKADMWIEYKYLDKLPKQVPVLIDLSQLQVLWLSNRHNEGRSVHVVIGSPEGCLLLTSEEWERTDLTATEFRERCMTKKELANWILRRTTGR